jgi:hypothetical protein
LVCATCGIDPLTGRPGFSNSTWLCESCAKDPANADWSQDRWQAPRDVDIPAQASRALESLQLEPITDATKLVMDILGLLYSGKPESYTYQDSSGHSRGVRIRRTEYTMIEISNLVGCSRQYVWRVVKRYIG